MDFSFIRKKSQDEEGEEEKKSFNFSGITEGGAKLFRRLSLSQDEEGTSSGSSSIKDSITEGSSRFLGSLGAKKDGLFNGISGITNKFDQVLGNKGEEQQGTTPPQLSPSGSQQRTPDSAQRTPERQGSLSRGGEGPPPRPPPIRQDSKSSLKGPPKPPPPKFNKTGSNGSIKQYSSEGQPSPVGSEGYGGYSRNQQPQAPRSNPFEKTSPPPTFDQAQPAGSRQFTYSTERTPAAGSDYSQYSEMNAPSSALRGAPVGGSMGGGLTAPQQDLLVITPTSQERLPDPVRPNKDDSDGDSSATEGCDDIVDPSDFDIVDASLDMFRTGSVGSDADWVEPNENQMDSQTAECVIFMRHFVHKIFMVDSGGLTQADKSKFGQLCQQAAGRLWFSRYITSQREHKKLGEQVFYQLVQHFAVALFECHHSEDYTPAKSLMNMCFTFYHEENKPGHPLFKHFLYNYLKEQPIWQSLRFWNAAFFDAVQSERARKPLPTNREGSEAKLDDKSFQQNITFGQLGTFTCNMRAFGLNKELCYEFLRKQATIANLKDEQVRMLKDNIDRWRD